MHTPCTRQWQVQQICISTGPPALSDFRTTRAASALLGTCPRKYYCIYKHSGAPMTVGIGRESHSGSSEHEADTLPTEPPPLSSFNDVSLLFDIIACYRSQVLHSHKLNETKLSGLFRCYFLGQVIGCCNILTFEFYSRWSWGWSAALTASAIAAAAMFFYFSSESTFFISPWVLSVCPATMSGGPISRN